MGSPCHEQSQGVGERVGGEEWGAMARIVNTMLSVWIVESLRRDRGTYLGCQTKTTETGKETRGRV